jgi:hypothetical protein
VASFILFHSFSSQDPLHRAAEAGETVECQHLLDVDMLDVDGRDGLAFPTTPLHLAAKYGHADVVAVLLNKGANMRLHRYCDFV